MSTKSGSNNGSKGGRPVAEVLVGLRVMLAKVSVHPQEAPTSKQQIAAGLQVDPVTLWRHGKSDPDVVELMEQLLSIGQAWHSSLDGARSEDAPLVLEPEAEPKSEWEGLREQDLARRAAQRLKTAQWAMQRFASRTRHYKHVSDLPRAVFVLDHTLRQVNDALKELRTYADEWLRRQATGTLDDHQFDFPLAGDDPGA